ncbi:MAG: TonB family protein [Brevundimonas sp.]|uniref:energy transducer TonB family protein n=1 Tax=Brevundimonas sp. TaxID=1871086 RepID=UPI0030483C92
MDAYEATVLAWVERHKKHPGGNVGAVTVGFTLDRRGNLRASHIVSASGNPVLDHAAIDQLKEASPFPRPPANTEWRTRDFRVRIDFKRRRT